MFEKGDIVIILSPEQVETIHGKNCTRKYGFLPGMAEHNFEEHTIKEVSSGSSTTWYVLDNCNYMWPEMFLEKIKEPEEEDYYDFDELLKG